MTIDRFEQMLSSQLKVENKRVAYPNGLYLSKITYDGIKLQSQQDISAFLKVGLQA